MKYRSAGAALAIGVFAGLAANVLHGQQAPAKKDFDAEIRTAIQSAKTAAGFEFFGTLTRVCLLPQSGALNTQDNVPPYVANPASAPPREVWYADPAKV